MTWYSYARGCSPGKFDRCAHMRRTFTLYVKEADKNCRLCTINYTSDGCRKRYRYKYPLACNPIVVSLTATIKEVAVGELLPSMSVKRLETAKEGCNKGDQTPTISGA